MLISKVKVENGIVVDGATIEDIPFPNDIYRADLADWLTAPVEVSRGWLYDGEKFAPPTE